MTRFPVADAHCDFLYYMVTEDNDIRTLSKDQCIHLPYMQQGGVGVQFFAAWMDSALRVPYLQQTMNMIDAYYRMLDSVSELVPFTPGFDPACGKIATVLTIEDGSAIEGSLANLRLFHRLGVRAMTLTWNETNDLAAPAMRKGNKGLTKLGKRVVREMCDIGMAIDVSHLSDAGIDDILDIADRPIFASHSNARAVYDHRRSLSDRHIKAIAEQGGVVGVNFYCKQLRGDGDASIADIVAHILHILEIGGSDCPAIGSDFNGMVDYLDDMQNSSMLPNLAEALLQAGLCEEQVKKICYDNLISYITKFY